MEIFINWKLSILILLVSVLKIQHLSIEGLGSANSNFNYIVWTLKHHLTFQFKHPLMTSIYECNGQYSIPPIN